jgi:ankyrin repeat protein
MAKLLLEFGADPNLKGKGGWKPMFLAARSGSLECLKALHATGKVDVKELDANGKSCLTFAQANKKTDCVAFLEFVDAEFVD